MDHGANFEILFARIKTKNGKLNENWLIFSNDFLLRLVSMQWKGKTWLFKWADLELLLMDQQFERNKLHQSDSFALYSF